MYTQTPVRIYFIPVTYGDRGMGWRESISEPSKQWLLAKEEYTPSTDDLYRPNFTGALIKNETARYTVTRNTRRNKCPPNSNYTYVCSSSSSRTVRSY